MTSPSPSISYQQLPFVYAQPPIEPGKRLVVAAASADGDFYQPLAVSNPEMVSRIFGSGPLVDRYKEISMTGLTTMYLVRIEPGQLDKTLASLMPFPFDLVYLDGFSFLDSQNVLSFIEFAKAKEWEGQLVHGIFDLPGLTRYEDLQPVFQRIAELSIPVAGGIDETGKYLSVVADQVNEGRAGAVYAGLVASLDPQVSPVNKSVNVTLKTEFSNDQILDLRSKGVVCFKNSIKKGVVCASASCAVATEDSVHKHISNFRIAQRCIQAVAETQEQFIGRVGGSFDVEQVEAVVESALKTQFTDGLIRDYRYDVRIERPDPRYYVVYTDIEIIPIFSIHSMTQTSQVQVRI